MSTTTDARQLAAALADVFGPFDGTRVYRITGDGEFEVTLHLR